MNKTKLLAEEIKQKCREYTENPLNQMGYGLDFTPMRYLQAGYILQGMYNNKEIISVWQEHFENL